MRAFEALSRLSIRHDFLQERSDAYLKEESQSGAVSLPQPSSLMKPHTRE
jgi:hypothetical protein